MATRAVFGPLSAEFPTANFPQLLPINNRPVLGFDAATSETAQWTSVAPQGMTGALTAVISYKMASATTGGVAFDCSIEAVTSGDATDLDAGDSFDTVNTAADTAVPATVGYMEQLSITLTNADSAAVADLFRLRLSRNVAHASDTATGDCYVLVVELRDAA